VSFVFLVPDTVDDPARPSGGNRYDQQVSALLAPRTVPVPAGGLAHALAAIPDGATVVIDGLLASPAADLLAPAAARLTMVVLMHMPLFTESEAAVVRASAAVIAVSEWTRAQLLRHYVLAADSVRVALPGVDPSPLAPFRDGRRLLCVAAVAPHKGHDVLLAALDRLADLPWTCVCVGSLDRDPAFVASLQQVDRVEFVGARVGAALTERYLAADVLVLPSRAETYGMVVAEALAHGLPVIATETGGVPEALGTTSAGSPGMLVPVEDAHALAGALRDWLTRADLRATLRRAAEERRTRLPGWTDTARHIAAVLEEVNRPPADA
jgi:glycosyltransferase involved in cell wall biosynthesis